MKRLQIHRTFLFWGIRLMTVILGFSSCFMLQGQRMPSLPNSIPVYNPLVLNPAITGSKDFTSISLTSKISQYPTNQVLSFHKRISNSEGEYSNFGIGSYLSHERLDFSWNTGLALAGSYHLPLDRNGIHLLSAGAAVKGFLTAPRQDKDLYPDSASSVFLPNADLGLYYYGPRAFAGVSLTTLLPREKADSSIAYSFIDREYYLMGGYKIQISKKHKIILEPSIVLSVNEKTIPEAQKHIVPYLKLYLQNFYLGTCLKDFDVINLFFQYQFPRLYTGVFVEFPSSGIMNNDNVIFELSVGLNLGKNSDGFLKYRHW